MKKFGMTWWGEKWLDALTHIDYDNRLPRGRSYANRGAVESIEIKKNKVLARVSGSRRYPYKVNITIPEFNKNVQDKLISFIMSNNYLLSKLLNRELPIEFYDFAEQNNIKIFPTSWRSFDMSCSCPDWAVPCKHIAATVYLLANEIDKNPFLVFKLHNFDIFKELSKRNVTVQTDEKEYITEVDHLFPKDKAFTGNSFNDQIFDKIDLTVVSDINTELMSLIDPNPIFYNKNFKDVIQKMYKKTRRYVEHSLFHFDINYDIPIDAHIQIIFNANCSINNIQINSSETTYIIEHLSQFINILNKIEFKNIKAYNEDVIAIYLIFQFSKIVVQNSAFIPQLIQTDENSFLIRWIPALINNNINSLIKDITELSPSCISILKKSDNNNETILYQTIEEQVNTISSLFISQFVYEGFDAPGSIIEDMKIDKLFFTNNVVKFSDFSEKEIPHTIQLWLNKYYIAYKKYAPIISIEEKETDETYFLINVLVENRDEPLEEPIAYHDFINNNPQEKLTILKDLTQIAGKFEDLILIINSNKRGGLKYTTEVFAEVLLEIIPVLKLFGIKILLPKSLQYLIKPKPTISVQTKKDKTVKSFLDMDTLLDFNWQIALGDESISYSEFQKLAGKMKGLVKYKDKYFYIDKNEFDKLAKALQNPPSLSNKDLLKTVLSGDYNGAKITISDELKKMIGQLTKTEIIPEPTALNAKLREYQKKGYSWLYKNSQIGFGSLIADDMGLGKTIQVLATLLKFKEEGNLSKETTLVVVPTTLLTNWIKEIEKFTPDLKSYIYHGPKRIFPSDHYDIILTTYGTVRNDIEKIKKHKFFAIVIDEAQNIKNPDTNQTKALKQLKSKIKFAMSGTPVENRLSEYWSIFDFVNKGYLGNLKAFINNYATPIQQYKNNHQLDKFRKITEPFIIRRLKTDKSIISDLPEKIENNQFCSLTKEQTALYEENVKNSLEIISNSEGIDRKGLVLKLMTGLKQICNHPNQYLKKKGAVPEHSGKMQLMLNLLENILENNEKTLIFTQYKEMGDILVNVIESHTGIKPLFLHGGINRNKRDLLVTKFQNERSQKIFILSLKAGGTGLNLTAANNVIHYDLWWNPAVETQATDRAYRIGQKKNVMVYRLLTKNTLEEKIDNMLVSKKELANMTVTSGEKWIGELSDKELSQLVKLGE